MPQDAGESTGASTEKAGEKMPEDGMVLREKIQRIFVQRAFAKSPYESLIMRFKLA